MTHRTTHDNDTSDHTQQWNIRRHNTMRHQTTHHNDTSDNKLQSIHLTTYHNGISDHTPQWHIRPHSKMTNATTHHNDTSNHTLKWHIQTHTTMTDLTKHHNDTSDHTPQLHVRPHTNMTHQNTHRNGRIKPHIIMAHQTTQHNDILDHTPKLQFQPHNTMIHPTTHHNDTFKHTPQWHKQWIIRGQIWSCLQFRCLITLSCIWDLHNDMLLKKNYKSHFKGTPGKGGHDALDARDRTPVSHPMYPPDQPPRPWFTEHLANSEEKAKKSTYFKVFQGKLWKAVLTEVVI